MRAASRIFPPASIYSAELLAAAMHGDDDGSMAACGELGLGFPLGKKRGEWVVGRERASWRSPYQQGAPSKTEDCYFIWALKEPKKFYKNLGSLSIR